MPPDLDALIDQELNRPPGPCKYLRLVADLTDEQRDDLDKLSPVAVARVLTAAGRPISGKGVRDHRQGAHTCG